MLHDIAPHIFHNEFSHRPAADEDLLLCFHENALLMRVADGQIELPTFSHLNRPQGTQFLFTEDERAYYLVESEPIAPPSGFCYICTREYRDYRPMPTLFACAVGETLRRWYDANRFCGHCGQPMGKSEHERALCCPVCCHTVYPKICPAVIVAICDGDRLLLTKYAGRAFSHYALVAGFAEVGESIEETVHREVLEEVGLRLGALHFYKSQPWVFTDTLLMGFYAQLEGCDKVRLQEDELSEGSWFFRSELPPDHSGISLTGEMIETFRRGLDPFSVEASRHT